MSHYVYMIFKKCMRLRFDWNDLTEIAFIDPQPDINCMFQGRL